MTSGSPCSSCKHYMRNYRCAAFEEIPMEIFIGGTHSQPYPGDHGIQWEPAPGWEWMDPARNPAIGDDEGPVVASTFKDMSHQELLSLFASVTEELRTRRLSRSSNNPVADIAEVLVATALNLTLAKNSTAGFDAEAQGVRYQIKARRQSGKKWPAHFGIIRDLSKHDFDQFVGVVFTANFDVARAALLPYEVVARIAFFNKHQNGHLLAVKAAFEASEAEDITAKVLQAWSRLPHGVRGGSKAAR